jgi:DNA-binding NtrC family response regulator
MQQPLQTIDLEFLPALAGESAMARRALRRAQKAVESDVPVVIVGEPGTGRAELAQAIHQHGRRRGRPFVRWGVRPSASKQRQRGRLRQMVAAANGGTLYIEEIARLDRHGQAELVPLLEQGRLSTPNGAGRRPYDVRIIAGVDAPIEQLTDCGQMRQDLAYSLAVLTIELEPLRRRPEDIRPVLSVLLQRHPHSQGAAADPSQPAAADDAIRVSIEPEVLHALERFPWPGNIAQLEQWVVDVVEAVGGASGARPSRVAADTLPAHLHPNHWCAPQAGNGDHSGDGATAGNDAPVESLADIQRDAIRRALTRHQGNRTQAARSLGISVRTLQRKIKRWEA